MEPFNGFLPLARGNYLLLGTLPENRKLAMADFLFGDTNSRPTEQELHFIDAEPTDVAAWTLVRTDERTLPKARSREELVLQSILQACAVPDAPSHFSAIDVIGRIIPRPRTLRTDRSIGESSNHFDDNVGSVNVSQYYASIVLPRLWALANKRTGQERNSFLKALARLGDEHAKNELAAQAAGG